ncbi:MAG: hypothetical protein QOF72_1912 [Blastocatellia bacterium]|jgi:hypothetical protein|nr:hypothetical protein [Blastocatellia bacterium]
MIGEVSHISEDGVWLSLRNRALLCWFLFLILPCLCYGQEKPPFDPSLVAPEKRIGRATATFSRHNSRAQIAVQTDAIQLVGNTEIGIILVPNFIVPGRKVVSPVSIELEFISYSHSKTFSVNRKFQMYGDDKLVYSGTLVLSSSGSSPSGIVTEVLAQKLPYAKFLDLIRGRSVKFVLGEIQLEIGRDQISGLRDLEKLIDSSIVF